MAVTSQRKLNLEGYKQFGKKCATLPVSDLTQLQTHGYAKFLQMDVPAEERENFGLEAVFRESFPITNYEGDTSLNYVRYELEKPRYTPDQCRQLQLTYGCPLRVRLRLDRTGEDGHESIEEDVYLGELPIMLGGGEFIINGAERVVVSQMHRSPGVDFTKSEDGDRQVYSCRIVPERGTWLELEITRKNTITVKIDQNAKVPVMTFLRALGKGGVYGTNDKILRAFYQPEVVEIDGPDSASVIRDKVAVSDIVFPAHSAHPGEIVVAAGGEINGELADVICASGIERVEVMAKPKSKLLLDSLAEDKTSTYGGAVLMLFHKLRPGNPQDLKKAEQFIDERFFQQQQYQLGRVGRFRMNRKLKLNVPEDVTTLRPEDVVAAVKYLDALWEGGDSHYTFDDIDHLGNRRLRTIDELAGAEIRKGFYRLRKTIQDRFRDNKSPRLIINTKNISSQIEAFFGRNELSQVVDQTNPLSMLTHERRLSALGTGGLNRKRAGFEVRDVHASHYGRVCPIETPEGQNIGLISHLALFSNVDEYGFLTTPYRVVDDGVLTDEVVYLRADEENNRYIAPPDALVERSEKNPFGRLVPDAGGKVLVRCGDDYLPVDPDEVDYIDVAPNQMIGVSSSLIPFLEHDDSNRALMGSNMQRQAVPLLISEAPVVGTGLEQAVAHNSSLLVKARRAGVVSYVDCLKIVVKGTETAGKNGLGATHDFEDVYELRKYAKMNGNTCENQHPIVTLGQEVAAGQVIADGACTDQGVLALGRNVLVAFMVWDGFNYEDAIILSEELVEKDVYTSIHMETYDAEVRDTKLGREEFTRDIPNLGEKALRNLDEFGVVRVGTYVSRGDVLVGKVSPKSKTELSPEEKLLHAIFGKAGEDVKNESLEVPAGVEGVVLAAQHFRSRASLSDEERKIFDAEVKEITMQGDYSVADAFGTMIGNMEEMLGRVLIAEDGGALVQERKPEDIVLSAKTFSFTRMCEMNGIAKGSIEYTECQRIYYEHRDAVEVAIDARDREINTKTIGDQLKRGVLQSVKVYIATKRAISVGDKMAGRHGNKGVISKILPKEDMPFMADGTPVQIMLNPLGVPSRMNVGQILETHLGYAAATQGYHAVTPVFDGATEKDVNDELEKAGLPRNGKVQLYDGRTGEPFAQTTTVGYMYMMKLHHLVDDKVHARSTGPYSLITQQPLGGKARSGGQRYGEMEVWALEAYGAAYTLQELLTVKSDDVEGRTKIYEAMVNGNNTLDARTPASFDVLVNEIKGLALNMELVPRAQDDFTFAPVKTSGQADNRAFM